jgi:hypothetical protein
MKYQKKFFQLWFLLFFPQYLEAMLSPSGQHNSQTPTSSSFPTRVRKRKRLREAMSRVVPNESPALHKRRSSVSDAGLLSMSGSFLDCTISPEKQPDGMFHIYLLLLCCFSFCMVLSEEHHNICITYCSLDSVEGWWSVRLVLQL